MEFNKDAGGERIKILLLLFLVHTQVEGNECLPKFFGWGGGE